MGAPDRFSAACFARASTPTSPARPKVTDAGGVGVTSVVLATKSAVTPTPPLARGSGLPGVVGYVLPAKLGTTPDDLRGGVTKGRGPAGGRVRGRTDGGECRFTSVRAPHSPTLTKGRIVHAASRLTTSRTALVTRFRPLTLPHAEVNTRRCAVVDHGMAMAQPCHIISQGLR